MGSSSRLMRTAMGPTVTTKSVGRIQKKIGNTSFTPTLAASSSAFLPRLHAHVVGVRSQALAHAGAEPVSLDQDCDQFLELIDGGTFSHASQRIGAPLARPQLDIDHGEFQADVRVSQLQLFGDLHQRLV